MRRISRHSLFAGSLVALFFGCSSRDASSELKQPAADAATVDRQPARHDFGEFSFETPAGWTRMIPDREKTKAELIFGGTSWRSARAMLLVDVGRPALPTPEELARSFAVNIGGTVAPATVDLDGTEAVKVAGPPSGLNKPCVVLVVYRNEQAYLIMAGAKEGVDPSDALEHVRATWKWARP